MAVVKSDVQILVVEDNPVDVYLIERALRESGFTRKPIVLDDGEPAIALLRRDKEFQDIPLPQLVILDLNLKRVDGPAVLEFIRESNELLNICVAVVSSSPTDVMFQRAAEANCYFSKPSDLESFDAMGKEIMDCYSRSLALGATN